MKICRIWLTLSKNLRDTSASDDDTSTGDAESDETDDGEDSREADQESEQDDDEDSDSYQKLSRLHLALTKTNNKILRKKLTRVLKGLRRVHLRLSGKEWDREID
jgi:hypothetical protein